MGRALVWVMGTTFAWAIFAFTNLMLYANNPTFLRAVVGGFAGAMFGALAGLAQWFVVRSRLRWDAWWIPATSLGWLCIGVLVPLAGEMIDRTVKLGSDYMLCTAAGGLVLGTLQVVFHRGVGGKIIWLFTTVIAWGVAGLVSWELYERLTLGGAFNSIRIPGWSQQVAAEVTSGLTGALVGGLAIGVISLIAIRVSTER
jgi:hypothetical protein